ncbi:unnamed protein product [Fraxinus pennsylvanica]|uniref:Pentatricopeptide repeat-containing protein n=1 Tax=Fraxinus pennsylvanica TaxID=56036 RepID=A0AAD1ZXL1_9LAMI|nr:unnamed protein product [Fraxinus pennsylvanica]
MNGPSQSLSKTLKRLLPTTSGQCESILHHCTTAKSLPTTKKLHAHVITLGLLSNRTHFLSLLISAYAICGQVNYACKLFDELSDRTLLSYKAMIRMYTENGYPHGALKLFVEILESCRHYPDKYTYPFVIRACGDLVLLDLGVLVHGLTVKTCTNLPDLRLGRCLHGWAIRQKLECDVNVETALIDLYAKCNCVKLSFSVFSRTSKKRTVPWNAVLSGCVHNKLARESLELFKQMLLEEIKPDDATWKSLLPAYAMVADLQQTLNIHGYLIRAGFISKTDIATGLVDIYSNLPGERDTRYFWITRDSYCCKDLPKFLVLLHQLAGFWFQWVTAQSRGTSYGFCYAGIATSWSSNPPITAAPRKLWNRRWKYHRFC